MQLLIKKGQVSLKEINEALMDKPEIGHFFTTETLRKYVYTLEKAGCKIKISGRSDNITYQLLESPIKLFCSHPQVNAVQAALHALYIQPIKLPYQSLINFLTWISPYVDCASTYPIKINPTNDSVFDNPEIQNKIERFKQLCLDQRRISVTIETPQESGKQKLSKLVLDPIELRFQAGQIHLIATDLSNYKKTAINLNEITTVEQLATSARTKPIQMMVQFKLKNKVAKNYRARPNETVRWSEDELFIKNKTDEIDPLLLRLMKYGEDCEILSPEGVRDKMRQLVNHIYETLCFENTPEDDLLVNLYVHQQKTLSLEPA
jgi:predicted DNA-binding transcriptional regulator YafY